MAAPSPKVALTIAGSDSGAGAGIQADLKTFAAFGVWGCSALTVLTAQNSSQISRTQQIGPAMVRAQIETVVAERKPDAIKTGALAAASVVRAVARAIDEFGLPAPVVDPVMVSSGGTRLLDRAGERALINDLLPIALVVTANLPEAEALTGMKISTPATMRKAAAALLAMGPRAVVIKGGHLAAGPKSTDVFYDGRDYLTLSARRIRDADAHGTGCAFSAAIAASLALGTDLKGAVRTAKVYITQALRARAKLGAGRHVLGYFAAGRWPRDSSQSGRGPR